MVDLNEEGLVEGCQALNKEIVWLATTARIARGRCNCSEQEQPVKSVHEEGVAGRQSIESEAQLQMRCTRCRKGNELNQLDQCEGCKCRCKMRNGSW